MTEQETKRIKFLQDELICKGGPKKGEPRKEADPEKLKELQVLLDLKAGETDKDAVVPEEINNDDVSDIMPEAGEKAKKPTKVNLAKPAATKQECKEEAITLEREIRRYVKRAGGYRRDLSDEAILVAKRLLKKAGRTKPEWNERIQVPGYDK